MDEADRRVIRRVIKSEISGKLKHLFYELVGGEP